MLKQHTALSSGIVEQGEELDQYCIGNSVAFHHDICTGLPAVYKKCDVFFIEPPWKRGFDLFNARAKTPTAFTYLQFMAQLSGIIVSLNKPTYIITGKSEVKRLPAPNFIRQIKREGGVYLLAVYNSKNPISAMFMPGDLLTTDMLLEQLGKQYNCVGDFFAGYGAAAVAFHKAGKEFVVSDFVKSCIGVIKSRVLEAGAKV